MLEYRHKVRRIRMVYKRFMTLLTGRGEGPSFPYAGQPMYVLAGHDGQPSGFAAMEITVLPRFAGPLPHVQDDFDEAIYVLEGRLRVIGDQELEAGPGSMFTTPRGHRHGFSNPRDAGALVLGIWAPAAPALAFMREVGAALVPGVPPDPAHMRDLYARASDPDRHISDDRNRTECSHIGMSTQAAPAQIDRIGVRFATWSCTGSATPNGGFARACGARTVTDR